jgi:hypothetical protein
MASCTGSPCAAVTPSLVSNSSILLLDIPALPRSLTKLNGVAVKVYVSLIDLLAELDSTVNPNFAISAADGVPTAGNMSFSFLYLFKYNLATSLTFSVI